ncbi:MAG: DUF6531 domain-containing protein, partial [Actinobacteria bacterium]|nr:DUF6531 domain-containing protein [Actinomycetota bacterium]
MDCGTGNFSYSHTDLSLPGRGIALALTTTYNSQDPTWRVVGGVALPWRWTTNYSMRVDSPQSGTKVVHQENASTVYFFDDGHGGWHTEGGAQATLANNPGGGFTFRRTHALTSFVFDASGRLVSEADRNGYSTTVSYDASGHLSKVTDPAGRSLSFVTDANGQITSASDQAGRRVSFVWDSQERLTRLSDAAGGITTFAYQADGAQGPMEHLAQITSPNANANGKAGNVVSNTFDGAATACQTGTGARTMCYAYSSTPPAPGTWGASQTTITDPNAHQVIANQQAYQLRTLIRGNGSAQQSSSQFSYDMVAMRPTLTKDPRGNSWKATYDASANLLTSTDPLNRASTYTYDAQNQLKSVKDPLGVTTSYGYDAHSNLTSVSRPLTSTGQTQLTSYGYDPARPGDLTSVTDPNGKIWGFSYDANGNLISQSDPLGDKTTFGYDLAGRLTSTVSPRGNVTGANPALYRTSYGYDPLGDLTSITDPLNHTTTLAYDGDQNLISSTDANLNKTAYTYDQFDELTKVTGPDLSTLSTVYDPAGNVIEQDDAAGKTLYGYDALNRVASETDPLNRIRTYAYDGSSNLTSLKDAANRTTSYGYDTANQLTSIAYSDGTTHAVSYGYDADGQRTSMSDASGPSRYAYDSLHDLTSHTDGAGHTVGYGYDLNNQLTAITYPAALAGGGTVTRGYDAAGRLASVTDWQQRTTGFSYDPDSELTSQSYPNGAKATNTYDAAGRITSITDTTPLMGQILNLSYGYDAANRLTTDSGATLGYDPNNRLKSKSTAPAVSYGYDSADNPTSATITGGSAKTLSYDAAHQLTSIKTTTGTQSTTAAYAYDQNGNRTSDQTGPGAYSYDQPNRLTASRTATYAYDGDGLRTNKTANGTAEPYTWDIAQNIPLLIGDAGTAYITGPAGLPLEQITSTGGVGYYHQDQLGSTRAITDSLGLFLATYNYDPYGNLTSKTSTITNPFGYAGQYTDPETGLQYLRARYYDPQTQNFLTRDPLTPQTRAPYNY